MTISLSRNAGGIRDSLIYRFYENRKYQQNRSIFSTKFKN
jgi:hypothetical protein